MEGFVFAGNRRRWKYLRPMVTGATVGAGLWFVALCWVLLKTPALPNLKLGPPRGTVVARLGTRLSHQPELPLRWRMR